MTEHHEWDEPGHRWFDVTLSLGLLGLALVLAALIMAALRAARLQAMLRHLYGKGP